MSLSHSTNWWVFISTGSIWKKVQRLFWTFWLSHRLVLLKNVHYYTLQLYTYWPLEVVFKHAMKKLNSKCSPINFIEAVKKALNVLTDPRCVLTTCGVNPHKPLNVHHQPSHATSAPEVSFDARKEDWGCSAAVFIRSSHDDISIFWTGVWPHISPPTRWLSRRSLSSPEMYKTGVYQACMDKRGRHIIQISWNLWKSFSEEKQEYKLSLQQNNYRDSLSTNLWYSTGKYQRLKFWLK